MGQKFFFTRWQNRVAGQNILITRGSKAPAADHNLWYNNDRETSETPNKLSKQINTIYMNNESEKNEEKDISRLEGELKEEIKELHEVENKVEGTLH